MKKLTIKELHRIVIDPYYAVNFNIQHFGEHEPMISKEKWVKANMNLVEEIGIKKWLEILIDVMENGQ